MGDLDVFLLVSVSSLSTGLSGLKFCRLDFRSSMVSPLGILWAVWPLSFWVLPLHLGSLVPARPWAASAGGPPGKQARLWAKKWSEGVRVQFKADGFVLGKYGGQRMEQGQTWLFLVTAGLQECRQSRRTRNRANVYCNESLVCFKNSGL